MCCDIIYCYIYDIARITFVGRSRSGVGVGVGVGIFRFESESESLEIRRLSRPAYQTPAGFGRLQLTSDELISRENSEIFIRRGWMMRRGLKCIEAAQSGWNGLCESQTKTRSGITVEHQLGATL